ncbi:MAG: glutamate--tRNA ligase [Planctomycetota bacterium]|jgi:glutamyl/glutaminyl-tRNA synthetase|nr:glutamate--tRNA ligase [Planctomycetota bacterium]
MTTAKTRTRFAPSPTGALHIGGARTAFLCMLFAKKHGGDFILRVEDTDQARNSAESLVGILEDMKWLGIPFAEGPDIDAVRRGELADFGPCGSYYQSKRGDIYEEYFQKLLAAGRAYYAWETPEELEKLRTLSGPQDSYGFVRPEKRITDHEEALRLAAGKPVVIRFVAPGTSIHVDDMVLGPTDFPAEHVNDFVIRKSDGMPTYHFAVVVDDALMRITHVIRAQEHFSNTPKHVALQQALGLPTPRFAHLPLVFNAQGKKMSKREKDKVVKRYAKKWLADKGGANTMDVLLAAVRERVGAAYPNIDFPSIVANWLADADTVIPQGDIREAIADLVNVPQSERPEIDVADFRKAGFFSDAILNYIALLGWSPGTGQEIFSRDELVQVFDLGKVSKTNARFDRKKLVAFNVEHCNNAMSGSPEQRAGQRTAFRQYLEANGNTRLMALSDRQLDTLLEAKKGWRLYSDVMQIAEPLFMPVDEIRYDETACAKALLGKGEKGREQLEGVLAVLKAQPDWSDTSLETAVLEWAAARGLELKDIAPKIRIALTGTTVSPALWPTLVLLGRDETLKRVELFLARYPQEDKTIIPQSCAENPARNDDL